MKANTKVYLQMPFREFVQTFPKAAELLKQLPIYEEFLNDPLYIVRVTDGKMEIGYTEDAWAIS